MHDFINITLIGVIFSGCLDTKTGLSYLTREFAAGTTLSVISQESFKTYANSDENLDDHIVSMVAIATKGYTVG